MVVGWLTRVSVTLVVLSVLLFDSAALVLGRVSAADNADRTAQAAANSWSSTRSYRAALLAAQNAAGDDEIVPGSLKISADGSAVVALHRTLSTLAVQHVPRLDELISVTETGSGTAPLK